MTPTIWTGASQQQVKASESHISMVDGRDDDLADKLRTAGHQVAGDKLQAEH